MFETFLASVVEDYADVHRVELIARESNKAAVAFYESLGFVKEGELQKRIRNLDGSFESDIPMGWHRPGTSA